VGYSPERINPGDREHRVETIVKVVSGCEDEATRTIADVYGTIITAGVYVAPSIMVAEAAKIIENTQRDINIALMNELKMIFDKLGVDWREVLAAANTKWNFLNFTPGLVGGHCIGVDPYYLAYEAQRVGHHPEIILAGRRINDDMAVYEASRIIKFMAARGMVIRDASILVLGATFKPNIADTRNSKVENLIAELRSYGCAVDLCDPHVPDGELFGCRNVPVADRFGGYDMVVKAVEHDAFKDVSYDYAIMSFTPESVPAACVRAP
jgi:UDP-N-acetyl-D-galactosamine dehydrogenase